MNLDSFLELIFPSRCAGCSELTGKGPALCEKCARSLQTYDSLFCGVCMARLPEGKKICHPDSPFILGAAINYHSGAAGALIRELKFKRNKKIAKFLADLLASYLKKLPFTLSSYEILAMPLSSARQRERGFNQAGLIAEELSPLVSVPILPGGLTRIKHSTPQSKIRGRKERLQNVSGAFSAKPELVAGKNIILLDDVITSGATMFEAARALKSAGVRKIIGLAAAKA